MSEQKRPTVIVNCSVPNGVQLRLHGPAVHEHAPQLPAGEGVMLRAGQNPGIDKEWFEAWLDENRNLSLVTEGLITAVDENEDPANAGQPRSAQRKEATMDHDVMHRDVQGLKKFRAEAEEAIAFYKGIKAAGGVLPAAPIGDDPHVAALQREVDSLGEAVTLLQRAEGQPSTFETRMAELDQRLTALERLGPDAADRLNAMLTWFESNQEGLNVLLSLDGEPDAPDTASGTANPGAPDASSAAAEKPATEPAPADQAAQAAPQSDQPPGSTG